MTFYYNYRISFGILTIACSLLTIASFTGCGGKTGVQENTDLTYLSATITEIDDHGNGVTDLLIKSFTERGWQLGDRLEVTFTNGQTIIFPYVENYSDVPEGEYLGRFSTSTKRFKIAINQGDLAKTLNLESPSKVILRKVK